MKQWQKPVVVELTAEQLALHIQAAARSLVCIYREYR